MSQLTPLERDILQACSEDDVGLWEAVWFVQQDFPEASTDEIKEIVLSALRVLLTARLIDAGRSVARGSSSIRDGHPDFPPPRSARVRYGGLGMTLCPGTFLRIRPLNGYVKNGMSWVVSRP
jgi:hypothetical protein